MFNWLFMSGYPVATAFPALARCRAGIADQWLLLSLELLQTSGLYVITRVIADQLVGVGGSSYVITRTIAGMELQTSGFCYH